MTWTPQRPTEPGRYWVSLAPHIRAELDALLGRRTRPCFIAHICDENIAFLHISAIHDRCFSGKLSSRAIADWLEGAQWLAIVEPADPHASPQPTLRSRIEALPDLQAEAERDAQAELVGKLTAERDDIAADLDEARAQVWGLICAGTNIDEIRRRTFEALAQNVNSGRDLIKVMIFYQRERDEARAQLRELESPRDLLTAENARLQQEVATLELLRRGGK